ncbi:MAG: restriction endonuclease subunit S [Shewanella sp.]
MVPKGWIASQVGDIAMFSSGGTPSKQSAHFWGGTEPWISGKDLKTHYLATSIDTLTEDGFKVAKKAPKGSSLILVRGMTLLKDFPVGYATREVAFNQDLKALVPNKDIDGLFLSFLLVAEKNKILQLVSTAGHGTGRLDTESIKSYPVNIPPLSEQNKIAKILSTWDKAISTTEQLLANSQQQKKALMQQLLTGKKRLLDNNGVRFSGEWESKSLSDIAEVYQPKTISQSMLTETGYPVYGANGIIGLYEEFNHATEQIAVTCRGSTCGVVNWTQAQSWITGNAMVINTDNFPAISKKFLFYVLDGSNLSYLISGSGQPQITGNIKTHVVKIPALEEQQKIATILSTADQEIIALQQKFDALKQEKKALMQQLLTGKRRVKVEEAA